MGIILLLQECLTAHISQCHTYCGQCCVLLSFCCSFPGAAAASALTAPKGSAVATAVLRPNQPGAPATVQIPSSAPAVIRTQLMAAGGRSGSPALQGTNLPASSPPEPARRVVNVVTSAPASMTSTLSMASAVGPSSRDPVQITIHQPRTVVDVAARPLVSPLSTRAVSPAVLQQQGVPQVSVSVFLYHSSAQFQARDLFCFPGGPCHSESGDLNHSIWNYISSAAHCKYSCCGDWSQSQAHRSVHNTSFVSAT